MISYPDSPGIAIHPLAPGSAQPLRIDLLPPHADTPDADVDRIWADLRTTSPRLHDGPILLAEHSRSTGPNAADSSRFMATGTGLDLAARPATYKALATAAALGRNVRALGVQGVVIARDHAGDEHLLLGRRGSEVRMYPGLWENAPSGGVTPPTPTSVAQRHVDQSLFVQALIKEGLEETGLDLSSADISWIAFLDDAEARSLDVVLRLRPRTPIDPLTVPCPSNDADRWEYAATAWTPTATAAAWARRHAHAISPPTRAVIQWLFASV